MRPSTRPRSASSGISDGSLVPRRVVLWGLGQKNTPASPPRVCTCLRRSLRTGITEGVGALPAQCLSRWPRNSAVTGTPSMTPFSLTANHWDRRTLPHTRIVVDHFHLVMLVNTMVTDVCQRGATGAAWKAMDEGRPGPAHRQFLIRGGDLFSAKALGRLNTFFATDNPTAGHDREVVARNRRFPRTRWHQTPAPRATTASSSKSNASPAALRNQAHYERRIMLHSVATTAA